MTGWYGGQSCACGRLQRPRQPPWRDAVDCFGNRADVVRRGAAAAADEIEQAGFGELLQRCRHFPRRLVVLGEGVGPAGVGVGPATALGAPRLSLEVPAPALPPPPPLQPAPHPPTLRD